MLDRATASVRFLSGEREPVRVATTANIVLDGLQTIDGIALAVNDRVLVKDQTDARTNGIYTASRGLWYRASDARFPRAIAEGVTVHVQEGTENEGRVYRFASTPSQIGVSDIVIEFYLSATFADDVADTVAGAIEDVNEAGATIVAAAEAAQAAAEAARDEALGAVPNVFVTSLAALKALDTTTVTHASLTASGLEGQFIWRTGDYSAQVTSDPLGGIYVKADAIATTAGAWVREGGWAVTGKDIRWFGAVAGGDPEDNHTAIQAAIDMRGPVVIPYVPNQDFGVSDTLLVRSNTTVIWAGGSFLTLTQPSTVGSLITGWHEDADPTSITPSDIGRNIQFLNPWINGGEQGYVVDAPYGENGVGGAYCENLLIKGGIVKGCRNGALNYDGTGGKGIQIENTVANAKVEGTFIMDCTIGCETGGTTDTEMTNIHYSNITMLRVGTMISARHTLSPPAPGVEVNSAVFEDIVGYNCGATDTFWSSQGYEVGAIALDRVNHVKVKATIWNEAGYGNIPCVIKHIRGNYCDFDVTFYGQCSAYVDAKNVPTGFGTTGTRNNNKYRVRHMLGVVTKCIEAINGDSPNFGGNFYDFEYATVNVALFDGDMAYANEYGRFVSSDRIKSIEGQLDEIFTQFSGFVSADRDHVTVGEHGFNSIALFTPSAIIFGLNTYADNDGALAGGLAPGTLYKDASNNVKIVV